MIVQGLEQNSNEWLAFRSKRIGASQVPAIMGKSPWQTRYELWAYFAGVKVPQVRKVANSKFATDRGHRWEPKLKALYELERDIEMTPTVFVHDEYEWFMASLDGWNDEKKIVLEIKCAGVEVYEAAKNGVVHEKYYAQVQTQILISGAEEAHFVVGYVTVKNGQEFLEGVAMVIQPPDKDFQKQMLFEVFSFWDLVNKKIAPPLSEKDYFVVEQDDQSTVLLFTRLKKAKEELERVKKIADSVSTRLSDLQQEIEQKKKEFDEIKEEAIEHVEHEIKHPKVHCLGVTLAKNKKGVWSVQLNGSDDSL